MGGKHSRLITVDACRLRSPTVTLRLLHLFIALQNRLAPHLYNQQAVQDAIAFITEKTPNSSSSSSSSPLSSSSFPFKMSRREFHYEVLVPFHPSFPPALSKRIYSAFVWDSVASSSSFLSGPPPLNTSLLDAESFITSMVVILLGSAAERMEFVYRIYHEDASQYNGIKGVSMENICKILILLCHPLNDVEIKDMRLTLRDTYYITTMGQTFEYKVYQSLVDMYPHLWTWIMDFIPNQQKQVVYPLSPISSPTPHKGSVGSQTPSSPAVSRKILTDVQVLNQKTKIPMEVLQKLENWFNERNKKKDPEKEKEKEQSSNKDKDKDKDKESKQKDKDKDKDKEKDEKEKEKDSFIGPASSSLSNSASMAISSSSSPSLPSSDPFILGDLYDSLVGVLPPAFIGSGVNGDSHYLLSLFDLNNDGSISLYEFLITLIQWSRDESTLSSMDYLPSQHFSFFTLFDSDRDEQLGVQDVKNMINILNKFKEEQQEGSKRNEQKENSSETGGNEMAGMQGPKSLFLWVQEHESAPTSFLNYHGFERLLPPHSPHFVAFLRHLRFSFLAAFPLPTASPREDKEILEFCQLQSSKRKEYPLKYSIQPPIPSSKITLGTSSTSSPSSSSSSNSLTSFSLSPPSTDSSTPPSSSLLIEDVYILSSSWWRKWHLYVGDTKPPAKSSISSNPLSSPSPPGPLDNSNLFVRSSSPLSLLPTLSDDDFVVVSPSVWTFLLNRFGITAGQPPILRTRSTRKKSSEEDEEYVELYPYTFTVTMLNAKRFRPFSLVFPRTGKLKDLRAKLAKMLKVPVRRMRIWEIGMDAVKHSMDNGNNTNDSKDPSPDSFGGGFPARLLDSSEMTLQDLKLRDRQEIALEISLIDGSWSLLSQRSHLKTGLVGLVNIGNSCFLSASMQCVAHTQPLTQYFACDLHMYELTVVIPTIQKGLLLVEFASLLRTMWNTKSFTALNPKQFQWMIGKFRPKFAGAEQQDAEELLTFVLNEIHESLNRAKPKEINGVKEKEKENPSSSTSPSASLSSSSSIADPSTSPSSPSSPSSSSLPSRPPSVSSLARQHWDTFSAKNNSIITDLFYFQVKSTLKCHGNFREKERKIKEEKFKSEEKDRDTNKKLIEKTAKESGQTAAAELRKRIQAKAKEENLQEKEKEKEREQQRETDDEEKKQRGLPSDDPVDSCQWESHTFEPYSTLSLALETPPPPDRITLQIHVYPFYQPIVEDHHCNKQPSYPRDCYTLDLPKGEHLGGIIRILSSSCGIPKDHLLLLDVYNHHIYGVVTDPFMSSVTLAENFHLAAYETNAVYSSFLVKDGGRGEDNKNEKATEKQKESSEKEKERQIDDTSSTNGNSTPTATADVAPSTLNVDAARDHSASLDNPNGIESFPTNTQGSAASFGVPSPVTAPSSPSSSSFVPSVLSDRPVLLFFVHRMLTNDDYGILSSFKQKLFNQPFLYEFPSLKISLIDFYRRLYVRCQFFLLNSAPQSQLSLAASRRPFTLREVNQQGTACSRCPWIKGCIGCNIDKDPWTEKQLEGEDSLDLSLYRFISIDWNPEFLYKHYDTFTGNSLTTRGDTIYNQALINRQIPPPFMSAAGVGPGSAGATTITNLLRTFTHSEKFEFRCGHCYQPQPCSKTLSFYSFPRILIIQLKRLLYDGSKISNYVDFPLTGLDLKEFRYQEEKEMQQEQGSGDTPQSKPSEDSLCPLYDIYAIVNHLGRSGAGHYSASVRVTLPPSTAPQPPSSPLVDRWFHFDDAHVREIDPDNVKTSNAYVLFYIRRDLDESIKERMVNQTMNAAQIKVSNVMNGVPQDPTVLPMSPTQSNEFTSTAYLNSGSSWVDLADWAMDSKRKGDLRNWWGSKQHQERRKEIQDAQQKSDCAIL